MAEMPPLHQRIILDASGVPAAVAETTAGLETIGAAATATTTKLAGTRGMMMGMFKGTALIAGIMLLAHELKHMKDETVALELAQSRLDTVLGNAKSVTSEQKKSANETAEAYTQLGFAHSDSTNAMATLVTATGSVSQAQKLMAITADYARGKHMSLADASMAMGRATQGNMKAFKAYGIALDTTLPKNQAIAKAFDDLNAKIGGTAKNSMNTFAVQLEIMREKFAALANKIGHVLLPILTKLVEWFGKAFNFIDKNSSAIKVYIGLLLAVAVALKGVAIIEAIVAGINPFTWVILGAIALGVIFVALWNRFKLFRDLMTDALEWIVKLIGYVVGGFASLLHLLSKQPGMGFLKGVADAGDKAAISIGKASKSIDDLKNKKMTAPKFPALPDSTVPGGKTGSTGNVAGGDAAGKNGSGGSGSGTVQNITVYASNTNDIEKKMAKAAKQGVPVGAK